MVVLLTIIIIVIFIYSLQTVIRKLIWNKYKEKAYAQNYKLSIRLYVFLINEIANKFIALEVTQLKALFEFILNDIKIKMVLLFDYSDILLLDFVKLYYKNAKNKKSY